MSEPTGEEYEAQLEQMHRNSVKWRKENPDKEVKVQWNFPKHVCIVAAISQAIETGYVTPNEAGLELIKALWPWDNEREPTVLMVRAVLEHEKKPASGQRWPL